MAAKKPFSASSEANDSGQLMWHSCVLTLCFHSYIPEHWNLSSGIEIHWWHVHTDIAPRQRAHNPCKDHPQKSKEARDTIRITCVQCVVDSVSHDSFPTLSRTCPTSVQVPSPASPEKFPHSSWYAAVSASSLTTWMPDLMDLWEGQADAGFCFGYFDDFGFGFPCTAALTNFVVRGLCVFKYLYISLVSVQTLWTSSWTALNLLIAQRIENNLVTMQQCRSWIMYLLQHSGPQQQNGQFTKRICQRPGIETFCSVLVVTFVWRPDP